MFITETMLTTVEIQLFLIRSLCLFSWITKYSAMKLLLSMRIAETRNNLYKETLKKNEPTDSTKNNTATTMPIICEKRLCGYCVIASQRTADGKHISNASAYFNVLKNSGLPIRICDIMLSVFFLHITFSSTVTGYKNATCALVHLDKFEFV